MDVAWPVNQKKKKKNKKGNFEEEKKKPKKKVKKSNVDEAHVQLYIGIFFQKLCPISPFSFLPILGRKFFCGSREIGMAIGGQVQRMRFSPSSHMTGKFSCPIPAL